MKFLASSKQLLDQALSRGAAMASLDGSMTRASLLWRIRNPADQRAWEEFVERYAPRIYGWCRARGLQEADCEEITQEVLAKLVTNMQRFEYDSVRGSYRGWLKTVTNHTITDVARARPREAASGMASYDALADVEARKSLEDQLAEEFDLEMQAEAMRRVKGKVQESTWTAFERRSLERQPAGEVAQALGLSAAGVHMANRRVKLLLQATIQELESTGEAPAP